MSSNWSAAMPEGAATMTMIETRGLTRRFGDLTAVDGVTLAAEAGECFGLLGPNGAGKTTLLKMLTTLLPPTAGGATVAGWDVVRQASAVRRVIGYVPQLLSADGALTGYENLLLFAKLYAIPRAERQARIQEALALMDLRPVAATLVRHYSGGMIRRLEIAQALLHRPRVLFLDEPTVGLDPAARRLVWEHIERLRAEYGTTIVLTTHYMDEADHLCQRLAIMHHGRVAALGTPAALKAAVGGASLDDVFVHYTDNELDEGGDYRDTQRTRRIAGRLG